MDQESGKRGAATSGGAALRRCDPGTKIWVEVRDELIGRPGEAGKKQKVTEEMPYALRLGTAPARGSTAKAHGPIKKKG